MEGSAQFCWTNWQYFVWKGNWNTFLSETLNDIHLVHPVQIQHVNRNQHMFGKLSAWLLSCSAAKQQVCRFVNKLGRFLSEKGNWNTWILCLYISCFSVQTLNWIESPITYPSRLWGMKKITLKIKVLVHQNEATSFACHRASVDFVYFLFFYAVTDCSVFQETFQFWFYFSASLFSLIFH